MRHSITPVAFANRATLADATYSVGAHVMENAPHVVVLNTYRADGRTDVLEMTPDEALQVAEYLTEAAHRVRKG